VFRVMTMVLYMFCIVTVVRVCVSCYGSGTCTCFVLTVVGVCVSCYDNGTVHVLYCDSGTCMCFVL